MGQVNMVCPFSWKLQHSRRQYSLVIAYIALPIYSLVISGVRNVARSMFRPSVSNPLKYFLTSSSFNSRMVSRDVLAVIVVNTSVNELRESDKVGVSRDLSELVFGVFGGYGQV